MSRQLVLFSYILTDIILVTERNIIKPKLKLSLANKLSAPMASTNQKKIQGTVPETK